MKKRILSLILALSMVLSVLPLGAFAEGSNQDLVMQGGFPKDSNGGRISCSGSGWSYETSTGTLYLNSGTYNFSTTQPVQCAIEVVGAAEITGGTFNRTVSNNYGTISDGTFESDVTNNSNINGGNFRKRCSVTNGGTITGKGTFEGSVTNGGTIENGTFNGTVTNNSLISGGTFQNGCSVTNNNTISGGNFQNGCSVINNSNISDGTFEGTVTNDTSGRISGGTFQSTGSVTNGNTIENGTFNGTVTNNTGTISGGTFNGTVYNNEQINGGIFQETCSVTNNGNGIISGGIFSSTVYNNSGNITNGTFAGSVTNEGNGMISGGTFQSTCSVTNGNGVVIGGTFEGTVINSGNGIIDNNIFNGNTGVHNITWDAASSKAKIKKVNGVSLDGSAVWKPYACAGTTVTITADTDIFSLNGQPIDGSPYTSSYPDTSKKTIVKFTMPNENVELNGAITCTDLVMEKGWPKASNEGKISCSGTGWEYIKKSSGSTNTGTLYLMSGSEPFDFNFADPATKITRTDAAVKCAIESYGTISGGIFDGTVTNNAGGEISDGTFKGDVENSGYIEKGTFSGEVTNNTSGTIFGGTFRGQVDNNGKITGGIFAAGLSTTPGTVTGGIFNGNTGLTGAHQVTVTNGSVSTVNDEGPRNADGTWDLYSYAGTPMTIIADTEIFSLNGQPIAESSYGVDKNTVKFTMPNANVVLNGAITSTDLVMENGWPKDSSGGKTPCKGDGWEYIPNDPTNGNMLLLTGSNQTGGLFDFSTIGDGSAVECNVFVGKPTAITGGEFNGKVFNNSGILGGTFHGEVDNMGPGRIVNGTFKNSVENNGMIENGTFHDKVKNNGTIEKGTFEGTVENNTNGTISGGTFAGSVSNNGGTVNGGIFNGNTGLDGVTDLHSITWDAASSNAKIEKVNGVSADWAPYVVTSNATTKEVTITADTEIFSLNGQPIAESSYGVDKKTVTFTMPDDDVVLNGELITKPEPEPEPEPKPEPTPKPEPEPEPTTYTVTVIGGTIDGKTSVSAKENDTLTVVLDQSEIPDGMTFDMWSISSSKLSGDINVDYRAEAMPFKMPAEDVTIRAQYRSAEIIEDAAPSPLATAVTIAVGGAAAGIVVWQGVSLGVDLYLANALPQGVPVPTDRRALALLLWETAGKPEVALPTLYGDIPAEEIELQKATRWAVQNGLMDAADKKDASFFDPDHYVTKMDVFGAWLRLKKLLGTT